MAMVCQQNGSIGCWLRVCWHQRCQRTVYWRNQLLPSRIDLPVILQCCIRVEESWTTPQYPRAHDNSALWVNRCELTFPHCVTFDVCSKYQTAALRFGKPHALLMYLHKIAINDPIRILSTKLAKKSRATFRYREVRLTIIMHTVQCSCWIKLQTLSCLYVLQSHLVFAASLGFWHRWHAQPSSTKISYDSQTVHRILIVMNTQDSGLVISRQRTINHILLGVWFAYSFNIGCLSQCLQQLVVSIWMR